MTFFSLVPFLALGSALGAQQPMNSAWLEWANLRVAIAPDSAGTYLWVLSEASPPKSAPTQPFGGTFDPARTLEWVADARAFLTQALTSADSGTVLSSPALHCAEGGRIYLARRRVKGSWSLERIIILESTGTDEPVMVNGDERSIGEIVDSLEAVARRTPLSEAAVRRDSIERVNTPRPTKPASADPRNRPPLYPQRELSAGQWGTVLLSFVIDVDGRADMQSIKVLHTETPDFLKSVLDAMPRFRFNPARYNDAPVRSRIVMPFVFSFIRR